MHSIQKTVNDTQQASLNTIIAQLECNFESAQEIADILLVDSSLYSLSTVNNDYSAQDYQEMHAVQKKMQSLLSANKAISNIYIYFNRTESILGQNLYYNYGSTETINKRRFGIDKNYFYQLMNKGQYADFIITGSGKNQHLFYLSSYKPSNGHVSQFAIWVEFDSTILYQLLCPDENPTFLSANDQLFGLEDEKELLYPRPAESEYRKSKGKYIICQQSTFYPNIVYYRLVHNNEYKSVIYKTWLIMAFYVIFCIWMGVHMSLKITRKNYAQLEKILGKLRVANHQIEKGNDDFLYINQVIGKLLNENEEIGRLRCLQTQARCNGILGRVLKGRQISLEQFWKECNDVGECFTKTEYFSVAVLRIEDGFFLFGEKHESLDNDMIDTIFMLSANIWLELLTDVGIEAFIHETDGNQAALIFLPAEKDASELLEKAEKVLSRTCHLMQEYFNVKMFGVMTSCVRGMAGISDGYDLINAVYNMKDLQGKDYPDVLLLKPPKKDSEMLKEQALSALQSGNLTVASELIDTMRTHIKIKMGDSEGEEKTSFDAAANDISVQEEKQQFKVHHFENICAYINQHCLEGNFSLGEVSCHFSMSSSYLTQLFKKKMGITPLDYVQGRRLKEAKRLLNEGLSVKDTAIAVGYYDVRTMTRAFRRYEGVTPSEYLRESPNRKF